MIVLFPISIISLKAQTEYRLGLGLYDIAYMHVSLGDGPPVAFYTNHQILNSAFLEKQNERFSHRISFRYLQQEHSLRNKDFRAYGDSKDYNRSAWEVGYTASYYFFKRKLLAVSLGVLYQQNKINSPFYLDTYVDFVNHSLVSNVGLEYNLPLIDKWYISPSLNVQSQVLINSKNSSKSEYLYGKPDWSRRFSVLNPRISLKRTIYSSKKK